VRVIAATNKDLPQAIAQGKFREDLYYRLNVVNIHIPPLRERKEDIPLLIAAFLAEFAGENGKQIDGVDPKARLALFNYSWPGNVRQLRNSIESAVVLCKGSIISLEDLPPNIRGESSGEVIRVPVGSSLSEMEKEAIRVTLNREGGNKSRTAEILGIGRKTLHRKLQEFGLASMDAEKEKE
jgi:DNA-binding NtrC family response regulator